MTAAPKARSVREHVAYSLAALTLLGLGLGAVGFAVRLATPDQPVVTGPSDDWTPYVGFALADHPVRVLALAPLTVMWVVVVGRMLARLVERARTAADDDVVDAELIDAGEG